MKLFYAATSLQTLPAGHRFPMGKYEILRQRLAAELPQLQLQLADPASDGELALVHTPSYVQAVVKGELSASAQREIGFPWSEGMVERARRSVGATVSAARLAMQQGIAANLAGGTHHAYADKGSGFCVFNDVAVAARLLQTEAARSGKQALQVAVIDLDVHQGNGTARIFRQDPSVFTLSLHGAKNFPFRKEESDLDIDLPDGCSDGLYVSQLQDALAQLEARCSPDLVFYLAGADPHEGDRLGRLKLSFEGLMERDRMVFEWAWRKRVPLAMAMAGGYGREIADTVQVQINTFSQALSAWERWQNQRP
ncbi:MAG: histone deacetylase [Burkholderiaceae bacterium]|jgi:acetoin utilization deacetylase AcuC-like enzyme|nr:histone deacetylase [Burkholderiaceae bacterium]